MPMSRRAACSRGAGGSRRPPTPCAGRGRGGHLFAGAGAGHRVRHARGGDEHRRQQAERSTQCLCHGAKQQDRVQDGAQVVLGRAADAQPTPAAFGSSGRQQRFDQLPAGFGQITRVRTTLVHALGMGPAPSVPRRESMPAKKIRATTHLGVRQKARCRPAPRLLHTAMHTPDGLGAAGPTMVLKLVEPARTHWRTAEGADPAPWCAGPFRTRSTRGTGRARIRSGPGGCLKAADSGRTGWRPPGRRGGPSVEPSPLARCGCASSVTPFTGATHAVRGCGSRYRVPA